MGSVCLRGSLFFSTILMMFSNLAASSVMQAPTAFLAHESGWIGRVEIISSKVVEREIPFQVSEARVIEVFRGRGNPRDVIFFSRPGGRVGERSLSVIGVPDLAVNQQYVVFLSDDPLFSERDPNLESQLQDWTAYEVTQDQNGKPTTVRRAQGKIPSRASKAYSNAMSFGVGAQSYDDLVMQIHRGLD